MSLSRDSRRDAARTSESEAALSKTCSAPVPEVQSQKSQTDLNLIAPLSHISGLFHRGCFALGRLVWRFRWLSLTLAGFLYLAGIVVINIPMLEISNKTSALVLLSPLFLFTGVPLLYLSVCLVLLAFFARHRRTRLGCLLLLSLLTLVPAAVTVFSDTRLLLILGDTSSLVLLVGLLVSLPLLYFRYKEQLEHHARWSAPAYLLVAMLLVWEGTGSFRITQVSAEQFQLKGCRTVRPINSNGVKGDPFTLCNMDLTLNGFEYSFPDMLLPDKKHPQPFHLEIRHALFDHFSLHTAPEAVPSPEAEPNPELTAPDSQTAQTER